MKRFITYLFWLLLLLTIGIAGSAGTHAVRYERPGGDATTDSRAHLPPFAEETLPAGRRALLERFAPVVRQCVGSKPHWDLPTRMNFDGDWIGRNNEQSLRACDQIQPALHYAMVETETHLFLTFFLFHPLDWERAPNLFWLGRWHENDGESVQVVVRKQDMKPVLLATQAHLKTHLYAAEGETFETGSTWRLESEPFQVAGDRPVLFVEPGGHGIYATDLGHPTCDLTPTAYELVPIHDTLWKMYRTGTHLCSHGKHGLVDGAFHYESDKLVYRHLPRHFDSDRLSFLPAWKFDAGILPFAFSHCLTADDLGVLFFEPARKYAANFTCDTQWSQTYLYNPYLK